MADATAKMERQDRILAELSELGLTLARGLHGRTLAAETAEEAQALSLAFHRISRSVRQTIALETKLDRERSRQDHDDRREAARRNEASATRRKAQVRLAVERAIWTEAEGLEAERLLDELDDVLEEGALSDGFLDGPVETLIARIQDDLGLAAANVRPPPAGCVHEQDSRPDDAETWPADDPVPRTAFNST
jgi:hypothetical protein